MKRALVCWFTGLSGAGKSTIAEGVLARLKRQGKKAELLDGDAVRAQRGTKLGFTREDILRNNELLVDLCLEKITENDVVLVSAISPFIASRSEARRRIGEGFREIYVKASIEHLAERDTKGLYRKSRAGEMENLIGVDPRVPYEPPLEPELVLETEKEDPAASIQKAIAFIQRERTPLENK